MAALQWNLDRDSMTVHIMEQGQVSMKISVAEIIESCHRQDVLNHVAVCDKTPWLTRWQKEKETVTKASHVS